MGELLERYAPHLGQYVGRYLTVATVALALAHSCNTRSDACTLALACRNVSLSAGLRHPIYYFETAATYAIQRKFHAQKAGAVCRPTHTTTERACALIVQASDLGCFV
jgi:hypothetical protein